MRKIQLVFFALNFLLFGCAKKNAQFEITNNTGSVLENVQVVTDSGNSFEIKRIELGASERVTLDRSEVGAVEVFVDGIKCFSLNTEGALGKAVLDSVPKDNIEPGGGINSARSVDTP